MAEISDAERLDRFHSAFEELKQSMEQLPSVTDNTQRRALWRTILTRQTEIEGLYPARVDPI